ncbi:Fc.00g111460.m01.CDS01 [Cosmosporella sp. VM-42]
MDFKNSTLWKLPNQQLPETEIVGPTFVTIWLFITAIFTYVFWWLLHKPSPTWPEFKTIMIGTGLLWYLIVVVDRWLHYDHRSVPFGYILLAPIWEFFYVGSANLILWGTFTVVWKEFEREERFTKLQMRLWGLAANFAIFMVGLVSLFYLILYLALAVVWMEFFSLNTIADVATKRTGFEISMTAFFFSFSLLTAAAATYAIFWRIRRAEGKPRKTRIVLWFATMLLFARSTSQFAIAIRANGPNVTRQDTLLSRDISHGLLTVLYLMAMSFLAWSVSTGFDKGGRDAGFVQSDVRKYILGKLQVDTNQGRQESPPFGVLLDDATINIEYILDNGPLSTSSTVNRDHKRAVAQEYIGQLRRDLGEMNPREGRDYNSRSSRPGSKVHSLFKSTSALLSGRRTASASKLGTMAEV